MIRAKPPETRPFEEEYQPPPDLPGQESPPALMAYEEVLNWASRAGAARVLAARGVALARLAPRPYPCPPPAVQPQRHGASHRHRGAQRRRRAGARHPL